MAIHSINPFGTGGSVPSSYPLTNALNVDNAQSALTAAMGKALKDELNEVGYLSGKATYDADEARAEFLDTENSNKWITINNNSVGSAVTFMDSVSNPFILRIPLSGVTSLVYSLFKTTSGFGSVVCNENGIVLWAYANTSEDNGTLKSVDVSSLNGASYALIGYPQSMTDNFVIKLIGSGAKQSVSSALVSLMNSGGIGGSGFNIMGRRFVDFGVMPSCLASDPDNFLPDGLVGTDATDASNYSVPDSYPDVLVKYADVIAKYDALVAKYPAYVSKHELGYDASGTIMTYYYTFKPKYYIQHAYIQAGIHGWEPDGVFALAEIMYLIANAYGSDLSPTIVNNPELMYLRGSVAFTVVPVANPWGFNGRTICLGTSSYNRTVGAHNYNDAELNTNWDQNQAENVNIKNLLDVISDDLSFAFDLHTTVSLQTRTKYGCFYGGTTDGCPNARSMFRTYEWLYEFYNVKYPLIVNGDTVPNQMGNGASISCPSPSSTGAFRSWCYQRYGIPSATLEHTDHIWNDAGATSYPYPLHTSVAMSVAVNNYLNHILQQVFQGYNVDDSWDVPSNEKYNGLG